MSAAFLMVWPWWALVACAALAIALFFLVAYFPRDIDGFVLAGLCLLALCGVVFLAMGLVVSVGRHYDRVACQVFGRESGYQTRFVIYNTFATDCLALTKSGRWISTVNLRGVNQ